MPATVPAPARRDSARRGPGRKAIALSNDPAGGGGDVYVDQRNGRGCVLAGRGECRWQRRDFSGADGVDVQGGERDSDGRAGDLRSAVDANRRSVADAGGLYVPGAMRRAHSDEKEPDPETENAGCGSKAGGHTVSS